MFSNILHLEGEMPETHYALKPGRGRIFAVIVEQLQSRATREVKIGGIELAAVHGLQLRQPQDARVEIDGFTDVGYVDGNVVDLANLQ